MTNYFLFAGDYQDDGTEGGMNDYVHTWFPDLTSAYEQIKELREHRDINYAHLASVAPNGTLSWDYDLIRLTIKKEDGLKKEVEAWREHEHNNLFIMAVLGEELAYKTTSADTR